jgi:hypothetical protein
MAFLCTFAGLMIGLTIWTTLYAVASESRNHVLAALAPYLGATSFVGQLLFVLIAAAIAWLTYCLLRGKRRNR